MTAHREPLPIAAAVHYLGCARPTGDGLAVPSALGPWLEGLAEGVRTLTVLAYDPGERPGIEDTTDHVLRPQRGDVRFTSLGAKGSFRSYRARRSRVAEIVAAASRDWDVLIFRLPNRRAALVYGASVSPRVLTIIGGHGPSVARLTPYPRHIKPLIVGGTMLAEVQHRRMMRASGLVFANSEALVDRYRQIVPTIRLVRSSSRRNAYGYEALDRMGSPMIRVCVVGRITGAKGVFESLDAFTRFRREHAPDATLHVIGSGDGLDELQSRATALLPDGAVTFYGWVADHDRLSGLYRTMDIMLLLSHAESLPRVVWDALAHSVLVISTPVGGLGTDFEHERDLLHVPVRDPSAATTAMARLMAEPQLRTGLIRRGLERAAEATVERVVDHTLDEILARWPELEADASPRIGSCDV